MIQKTYIGEISESLLGKEITIAGWVHTIRKHGKISFVLLRDKTGRIQCTLKKDILREKYEEILNELTNESVVRASGIVKEKAGGGLEIEVRNLKILNRAERVPIEIWNPEIKTGFMKRIQYRFLDLRKPEILAIFKVRNTIIQEFREYLLKSGFMEFQTPKIVKMGAESGAEVFRVDYYGKEAYLAQSPQLYKQMLMASGVDKYFEFGWYWRAEKSHTSRHLTEFYGLDIEMAWIESHLDIIKFSSELIKYVIKETKRERSEELEILNIDPVIPKRIPVIELKEAYKILEKFGKHLEYGSDLDTESERILGEYFLREYEEPVVFVINYPWKERPFYHMRLEEDSTWTKSFDALYNGLEILTGAQREHRYEILLKQAKEKNISLEPLKYYLEAFRYGIPPHGGFGLGIDRFVKQFLGLNDVREAVLWFRDPEHLLP